MTAEVLCEAIDINSDIFYLVVVELCASDYTVGFLGKKVTWPTRMKKRINPTYLFVFAV